MRADLKVASSWKNVLRVVTASLALLYASLVASCQSTQPAASTQPQAAPAAAPTPAPKTIKIGIQSWMTGPAIRSGTAMDRFYRMGIDEVNAKGGVKIGNQSYRFEAVTADDKNTSEGGRDAANRLALAEKVQFVLGGNGTTNGAAQPVYESNKVLNFVLNTMDQNLGPQFPLTLQAGYVNTALRSLITYDWLVKNYPQAKRVMIVGVDNASGRGLMDQAEAAAKAHGLTVVGKEAFPQDLKDFDPLVTRIMRQQFDALDLGTAPAYTAPFIALAKSLRAQGFRNKPFFGQSADLGALRSVWDDVEGFTFLGLADWNGAAVPDAEKAVIRKYVSTYGEAELELTVEGVYVAPTVLAQGMAKSGNGGRHAADC